MTSAEGSYAVGTLRDQFLAALERGDAAQSQRLASQLVESRHVLPGMVCDQIGVPRLSTYGFAAHAVLNGECDPRQPSSMSEIHEH
ncbi:MAG: hypothetical protein U1F41_03130 [Burkholderiales bacterium]